MEVLASKTRDWIARHNTASGQEDHSQLHANLEPVEEKLEGPGLYVLKHRERQCFQMVGLAPDNVFTRVAERLKAAFDGSPSSSSDPLSSLLVISLASDWDFYFLPVATTGKSLFSIILMIVVGVHRTHDRAKMHDGSGAPSNFIPSDNLVRRVVDIGASHIN